MYIIFDTETTGLPRDWNAPITDTSNWPRIVQIAWQLHGENGELIEHKDFLVKPDGFDIPFDAERIHGISTDLAYQYGEPLEVVLNDFKRALGLAKFVVGHNVGFDLKVTGCEFVRLQDDIEISSLPVLDTCTEQTALLCKLPGGRGGKFKLPTLSELHEFLFQAKFDEAHNATADVEATTRCFLELIRTEEFTEEQLQQGGSYIQNFKEFHPAPIGTWGIKHLNLKEESTKLKQQSQGSSSDQNANLNEARKRLAAVNFSHLHNHTQYSVLQSTIGVKPLIQKAASLNMPAVALTDTGNMMAAFHFEKAIADYNKSLKAEAEKAAEEGVPFTKKPLKPIIGCEFNVCRNLEDKTTKDNGAQVVLLAKNKNGYQNLIKLSSIAFTKGFYYIPRIDKNAIDQYKEDLIVLSGNLNGEIPNLILNVGEVQAENSLLWWKEKFGDDFYLEIMRHGQENEDRVNETLLRFSKKHDVKIVATNNTFYLEQEDAPSHDVLLCIRDGELVETPKGRGRGFRYGLENNEYYFKDQNEMKELFLDLPSAIENSDEIVAKCEQYGLARDVLLPAFDIPEEFQDALDAEDGGKRGENNFLRHLSYVGAAKRYGELTDVITERLDFELQTIANTGYPGYFLIVQDFCQAARDMGVSVGPGRGSAAGSAVAYCTGITNVDPIKFDLLFERFLNPERVSMPDIDIDFDDEGRGRVIDYVIKKYGANQVAQIVTYGTMAAKSSIRDAARVLNLELQEADRIAKLIPNLSLEKIFGLSDIQLKEKLDRQEDFDKAKELRNLAYGESKVSKVIHQAIKIEGSLRNTGIHACGVIITPEDITNFVPVTTAKNSDMFCTQYDNSVAEAAGLLKMDFLGLKTLTLIKDSVRIIKERHGVLLDPDNFPDDDLKTYELFQRGETIGIFQYESPGMQKYLRDLQPTVFGDLIAMNALYRPGPIEYIPSFIKRKLGEEPITYDIADTEEYLKETYGITVYQEQVMLLSQKLADFTKGQADTLRKAMGKKQKDVLDKMKPKFISQAAAKGHPEDKLEKIWKDWEAFASYAFNKSHSTCYAWVAYQTAYLKANYGPEYMASVLSNNMSDLKNVTFFMEECRRMGIQVLPPDVNESNYHFTVNKDNNIRFGLGAIKGIGSAPVDAIIAERKENGNFVSAFDFAKRINLRVCSKKVFESLVKSGGFDSFTNTHRAQYFHEENGKIFLEKIMAYGASQQDDENSSQVNLFGGDSGASKISEPTFPKAEEWTNIHQLRLEKEVIGIYISGHPLDDYRLEIESFTNANVSSLKNLEQLMGKDLNMAVSISFAEHRTDKNGNPFGIITVEDDVDTERIFLFGEKYLQFREFVVPAIYVLISGKVVLNKRYNKIEFDISKIELLSEVRESRSKSFTIRLNQKQIEQKNISEFHKLMLNNEGKVPLKFTLFDEFEKIEVQLNARAMKVNPSNELLKQLDRMEMKYKLN
ncbi:MAG: DNA polymerase III subunit alpha [Bacteroidota bacterium]